MITYIFYHKQHKGFTITIEATDKKDALYQLGMIVIDVEDWFTRYK